MFWLIKQVFSGLLASIVNASNQTKYISLKELRNHNRKLILFPPQK